jgi:hypothetical protein
VGLIALVIIHVYFGLRPEKRPITKSMIFGWMSRDFVLKEHDPARWVGDAGCRSSRRRSGATERCELKNQETVAGRQRRCWLGQLMTRAHEPKRTKGERSDGYANTDIDQCGKGAGRRREDPEAA